MNMLPRNGKPVSFLECASQRFVRTLAYWPVYTALITTLILVIQLFHPFGLGR